MISLDLSTSAKLALIWIILKCCYVLHLILDLIWIILVFVANFVLLKLFYFILHIFNCFCWRINKANIHNNIIDILSFQNGLNNRFSSTDFCFKSKVIKSSHMEKCFIIFGYFFSKCTFLRLCHFFLCSGYPINSVFLWQ